MIDTDTITLTEAAAILQMHKSNVAAFLRRRDIEPVADEGRGRLWLRSAVERARDEYEASGRRSADRLRGAVMRGERPARERNANPTRTGTSQKQLLLMLGGQEAPELTYNQLRSARKRLFDRGLLTSSDASAELTEEGRGVLEIIKGEGEG